MGSIEVRPFHRRDRQQLTDLVNAHAAAVVPGMGVSASAVLSELERQPGEFIVDPWVSERVTLIAACVGQLERWGVSSQGAGGELPVRGVYGVPEQWPHIRGLYQQAGFSHTGHTEVVYLAEVAGLPHPTGPPIARLAPVAGDRAGAAVA